MNRAIAWMIGAGLLAGASFPAILVITSATRDKAAIDAPRSAPMRWRRVTICDERGAPKREVGVGGFFAAVFGAAFAAASQLALARNVDIRAKRRGKLKCCGAPIKHAPNRFAAPQQNR